MRIRNVVLRVDRIHSGGCAVTIPKYDPDKIFVISIDAFPVEYRGRVHPGFQVHVDISWKNGETPIIEKWYLV